MTIPSIPNILSIAGSDPSGGAGVQADLKTIGALGGYGACVITALTAQNTQGVTGVHAIPPAFIAEQLETLFADVHIDAVKVGMVASPEVAGVIAEALARHPDVPVVLDPVMVTKGGHPLVDDDAARAVAEQLLPRALIVTPNIYEAARLAGMTEVTDVPAMEAAAAVLAGGDDAQRFVLVKGGALRSDTALDVLRRPDGGVEQLIEARVDSVNVHGTGCTLSSAIATLLPQRHDPTLAIIDAKRYVAQAIAASVALDVGHGHGPVNHFFGFLSPRQLR